MKKILFTGGTGFLGRNLIPHLRKKYDIYAPTRQELDLKDTDKLREYIMLGNFDIIIHAAIPNLVSSESDQSESLIGNSLLPFMTFYHLQDYYGKMIYFGSGAEFNKNLPIKSVREEDFGKSIPTNEYGIAKFVLNELCLKSEKIYNLRIFGCYGPMDADFKLITYAILCCLKNKPIIVKQNCLFDYMHVFDLFPVVEYFINNEPVFRDYNICSGKQYYIQDICKYIIEECNSGNEVIVSKKGLNNEYTGNNMRIEQEISNLKFTEIKDGIRMQIKHEREKENEKKSS